MSVVQPTNPKRRISIRRLLKNIALSIVPALLLLAIIGSAGRVLEAYNQQQAQNSQIESRSDAYHATATALSDESETSNTSNETSRVFGDVVLVQQVFATNTPSEVLVTETPIPTLAPPTLTPLPFTPEPLGEAPIFDLPAFFFPPTPEPGQTMSGTAVPTQVPTVPRDYNLVNILLLGGDDEVTNDNFLRTDTMIIVSVNLDTGTAAMLSLPRDMFVYVPNGTMARLNVAYFIGENIGWEPGGGFGLLRSTIFYNFGINVHYYAKVNFSGFEQIIDTLGGVDVGVDCTYQDWYPVDDFDITRSIEENYYLRTLDIGYHHFNGFDALWYARTRKVSDDFDRGRRQQQILRAIWRKARDTGQLANLPSLWPQLAEVVETDLSFENMLKLLPYALNIDINQIENFQFVRTYHTTPWQPPSGDYVQLPVYDTMRPLLEDFYQPPTSSQLALSGSSIAVYNGTDIENLDLVASERLRWEGFSAVALGKPEDGAQLVETSLADFVASDKGSLTPDLASVLNIKQANMKIQPDPNRIYDYAIIIGDDYNSCTYSVLAVN